MDLIADILLVAGALGATIYCFVLSRRLTRFTDLQGGMGGAVASLSAQVDEMSRALERSRRAAEGQSGSLERSTRRAEDVARRLDLLVAAMHDLPAEATDPGRTQARKAAEPAAGEPASERPAERPDPRPEARSEARGPEAVVARPEPAASAPESASEPVAPTPTVAPAITPTAAPEPAFEAFSASAPNPAPCEERADEGWTGDTAGWDDWDPFEVSEPPPASPRVTPTAAPPHADRTAAPGPAAPGTASRRAATEPAPKPASKPASKLVGPATMPIFTAARPAIRTASGAPLLDPDAEPAQGARRRAVGE